MRITRIVIAIVLLVTALGLVVAQEEVLETQDVQQVQDTQSNQGVSTLQNNSGTTVTDFQEISVDLFEDPTLWSVHISSDFGISIHQRFDGGASGKTPLAVQPTNVVFDDSSVLGLKTEFIRRGFTEIAFTPARPIAIPGFVQELSIWVVGRELPHELYFRLTDIDGDTRELYVGELNFRGWQQLSVEIPGRDRLDNDIVVGLKQFDPRRPLDSGLALESIVIKPLYTEAYGTYYVYFDDMRALTDLSIISQRDLDDPIDAW